MGSKRCAVQNQGITLKKYNQLNFTTRKNPLVCFSWLLEVTTVLETFQTLMRKDVEPLLHQPDERLFRLLLVSVTTPHVTTTFSAVHRSSGSWHISL